jgi:pimeloyl-ACP methyl ester carboxylesterase
MRVQHGAEPYPIRDAAQTFVDVGDARLSVYEAGERGAPAVVFSHGFPELAYSWRHQLPALASAGFHAIAPDQRGYGGSDRPRTVEAYDIVHLTGDLVAVLDAWDIDRAVFVGHDWGGMIVWQMPFRHRDRVAGVVGVNTPHFPRLPMPPIEMFRNAVGENFYIVWFQTPDVPDRALAENGDVVLERMLRRGRDPEAFRERAVDPDVTMVEAIVDAPSELLGPPLLAPTELAVYRDTFRVTGFTGGINWYRNFDRNWELGADQPSARIDGIPCLMVAADWDPVLPPAMTAGMPDLIDDLEIHEIAECGHWTQQERPDEFNRILLDWLRRKIANS